MARPTSSSDKRPLTNDECLDYLNKHKIPDVLNLLTASVVFNQPHNSRGYMIKLLEKLKEGRDSYKNSNDYVTPVGPEPGLIMIYIFKSSEIFVITKPDFYTLFLMKKL